jgi:hypothetical protein
MNVSVPGLGLDSGDEAGEPAGQPPGGTAAAVAERARASWQPARPVLWVRHNWVVLVQFLLIIAGLAVKAAVLDSGYFRQDDFYLFDWALNNKLDWRFLGTIYTGHFMPGSLVITWLLARASLYNWALAAVVNLAFLGAAGLALMRLLRTLFGNRPANIIVVLVYCLCPLAVPGLTFWATTLQWVPTQLALFLVVDAHVRYVQSGRFRHAIAAAAWLAFGLLFDEALVFAPLLLLGLTSAFFTAGPWRAAVVSTLRRYWRAWVLYVILPCVYAVVFLHQLPTSTQGATKPGQFSIVLTFISSLLRISFVPTALGGPWRWISIGDYAYAIEYPTLDRIAWVVAGLIVLASLWYRRHALRAWVILAGWVFLTAVVPLVLGRVGLYVDPVLLGSDLHYLCDSLPVLAICLGLAFLPVVGEQDAYRAHSPRRLRQFATAAVLAGFLAGSLVSARSYIADTSSKPQRSFIATARAAIAQVPRGTVIWSTPVPVFVQEWMWYGHYGFTASLIGRMASPGRHLRWTTAPSGVIPSLRIFDGTGSLRAVLLGGQSLLPPARLHGCWAVTGKPTRIKLGGPIFKWPWELSMWYAGPAATMAVEFGGVWHQVSLPAGTHEVWVPAAGAGAAVEAKLLAGGPRVCISELSIGTPEPSLLSQPVPSSPLPG